MKIYQCQKKMCVCMLERLKKEKILKTIVGTFTDKMYTFYIKIFNIAFSTSNNIFQ